MYFQIRSAKGAAQLQAKTKDKAVVIIYYMYYMYYCQQYEKTKTNNVSLNTLTSLPWSVLSAPFVHLKIFYL